jgi:asparagine synthase (glutamine-hydrolysing)
MCGICGLVNVDLRPRAAEDLVRQMTVDLRRRGPDDEGVWSAPGGPATALGFRRLAIIDPSSAGAQPMRSARADAVLVFNGEIYNHRELGHDLEHRGVVFRSTSDTEVLLEGLVEHGVDFLPRLRGMFAFALFRADERTVLLGRDHAGIKPLFYAQEPRAGGLAFSSRYDSLFRTGWLDVDDIDPDGFATSLELKAAPAPGTLHRGAAQLSPGTWLRAGPEGRCTRETWWRLPEDDAGHLRGNEAVEAVGEALERSVRRHLVSDVAVGVFLSGGVDSPLVAGTAARASPDPLSAFTVAFPGWRMDEGPEARRLAADLGVDCRVQDLTDPSPELVAQVVEAQDEPINDWSIIPTLVVSELARRDVKVALSGDGGDELFFGYQRPRSLTSSPKLWRLPRAVRAATYLLAERLGRPLSGAILHSSPARYYRSVHSAAPLPTLQSIAPSLAGHWSSGPHFEIAPTTDVGALGRFAQRVEFKVQLQRILRKVDMASMFHGLEVRVPLLDVDLIAVAFRIDPAWSLRAEVNKPVLRSLLGQLGARSSPAKAGFGAPMSDWMAGPLRQVIDDTFAGELPAPFDGAAVRRLWAAQRDRRSDHRHLLWGVASLLWWRGRVRSMTA